MRTKIKIYKRLNKLPAGMQSRLSKLCFAHGELYPSLCALQSPTGYLKCSGYGGFINTIEVDGVIQGWSLVQYDSSLSYGNVMLYVSHAFRKKGFGKRLLAAAQKDARQIGLSSLACFPHDEKSYAFFSRIPNCEVEGFYDSLIRL